jgi:putative phosphoesterase
MNELFRRIGVIGDVHCEAGRLERVLNFLASEDNEGIFCVGDVVDGMGSADICCQLLEDQNIVTIMGNHDQWCLENSNRGVQDATLLSHLDLSSQRFLRSLPKAVSIDTVRGKAMICHGLGENNMASVRPTDSAEEMFNNLELWAIYRNHRVRFVVNGHTHRAELRTFKHLNVINAGSLNGAETACCAITDFENATVEFFDLLESGGVRCRLSARLNCEGYTDDGAQTVPAKRVPIA